MLKSWQVELKVHRLCWLLDSKLASCTNMSDYESAHLVSCQELTVCGRVGRFIISKVHIDIIAKSVIPKT